MMDYIALVFNIFFMVLGYWKDELWALYISAAGWLVLMGFTFNSYSNTEMMWYYAWLYLAVALICCGSIWWFKKRKDEE
jgi:hypothetical protein